VHGIINRFSQCDSDDLMGINPAQYGLAGLAFLKPTKWTSSLSLPSVAQIIPQKIAPAEKLLVADGVNVILCLLLFPPTFTELC